MSEQGVSGVGEARAKVVKKYPERYALWEMERRFQVIAGEALEIFGKKNREYGNTIKATGVLGAVTEIVGVAGRLIRLVLVDNTNDVVNTRDKLMDGLIYCAIGLMMLDDENYKGEEDYLKKELENASISSDTY